VHAVVIGGGIIGITSALELVESGCEVTIIDRAGPTDGIATNVNAGLISPGHALSWSSPAMVRRLPKVLTNRTPQLRVRAHLDPHLLRWGLAFLRNCTTERAASSSRARGRLGRRSAERLRHYHSALGLRTPLKQGMVFVHADAGTLEAQFQALSVLRDDGHALEIVDRDRLFALEPSLIESAMPIAGAVYHPEGMTADSMAVAREILDVLTARATRVVSADATLLRRQGNRVVAAVTSTGDAVEGDVFVVTSGVHTESLLRRSGVRSPMLYAAKGYGLTWSGIEDSVGPQIGGLNETDLIAWSRHGDRLRVTGIAEFNRFDARLHQGDLDRVVQSACRLFPFLKDADSPEVGFGYRPMTADGLPKIGRIDDNLFVNTGHGNLGWTMAFGSAEILAAAVRGEPADDLARIFTP
jgi:D-amino-acid dehydrogenase